MSRLKITQDYKITQDSFLLKLFSGFVFVETFQCFDFISKSCGPSLLFSPVHFRSKVQRSRATIIDLGESCPRSRLEKPKFVDFKFHLYILIDIVLSICPINIS